MNLGALTMPHDGQAQTRDALRLTVPKELALECQNLLSAQGVPLNVTQAVKAMLQFAVQIKTNSTTRAAQSAVLGENDGRSRRIS